MNTEDLVLIPRGLLGSARYAIKNKVDAPNTYAQLGAYAYRGVEAGVLDVVNPVDEAAALIEVDRDIKAANLQLLVEKVLAAVPCIDDVADCVELRELEELARSLKQ